ncbi:zinc ABC transporter substrate-binding protein [Sedimentibacter sp. zth1]|uniref:metal ABC transporter substrate-binding protein n=1 Tax=Sedimentibacter sp. zth1 TaxID=2816908 RepID=UPI001A917A20|nr:zinc ABC transporter substrate-binding protein [Sedimentibacter sp. zth1]QSX05857.1 zinc ABC transporter substrate-binding protein [Sedimentibacter sp. zth1]
MKQIKILLIDIMLFLSFIVITGCSNTSSYTENENIENKITVAVSLVPEKTFVEKICKDKVNIITIIPPGASPENYEPTPQQKAEFEDATIYFTIGVQTESNNILSNVSDKTRVISLEDKVSNVYNDLKIGEERDPHIWMSPKRAIVMVNAIAEEIGKIDSKNKSFYDENALKYIQELEKLDKNISETLKNIKNRKFIVFHPAFNYLADDYNMDMYSLEEEGKEATPQHLQKMIDFAKKENIKVIFYQAEIDSSQSEAFAEEINGKTMMLEPLSPNYIENLESMANTMAEAMK